VWLPAAHGLHALRPLGHAWAIAHLLSAWFRNIVQEEFTHKVKEDESFWTFEDGVIHIQCEKTKPGETWASAIVGHAGTDELTQEEDKKAMMLQRFQKENPGFDFSGASFNGAVPDATQFMGGMKTTD